MLKYKLIYKDDHVMRYEYYPAGDGDTGIVEFINGDGRIIKDSKDDFDGFYSSHALHIDLSTEEGTIAWY